MRRAAKVDSSQKEIVEGLRKAGYRVEVIGRPVDLLVGRRCGVQPGVPGNKTIEDAFRWWLLELKTPTKTGKIRKRKDQQKQDEFIEATGTPRITTLQEALFALTGYETA